LLGSVVEEKLKKAVLVFLKEGRADWDVPHTLNSVYWMKRLIEREGGDEKVLVSTMYLHDIGYPTVEEHGINRIHKIKKLKEFHAVEGAKKSEQILRKLGGYSEPEIKEIVFLVEHHDDVIPIDSLHWQLVFEADNLAKLDVELVTPTFDKVVYPKFLEHYKRVRVPLFKTKAGNHFLSELLPKAESFFRETFIN